MESWKSAVPAFCVGSLMVWSGLATTVRAIAAEDLTTLPVTETRAIVQVPNHSGYAVLHVNATSGNDAAGDGTQLRPYKTITYALSEAEPNTLILLARGSYSSESGEVFPLRLKSGVTVQGMAGPNASDVLIHGGGDYYSAASGMQNVTILGANNAGLANVTVSNPHSEGTGLWIETGSPIVLNNAFFSNDATGIYIAGGGAPVIRGNYFAENGQAGLVIAGPSTAKVEANVFENTGVGITVAPGSSPELVNNRITGNLDGLIVHAEARPKLQGNQIARNRRNSIIDYAAWTTVPTVATSGTTQPPPPTVTAAANTSATPIALTTPELAPTAPPATSEIEDVAEQSAALAPPESVATGSPAEVTNSIGETAEDEAPVQVTETSSESEAIAATEVAPPPSTETAPTDVPELPTVTAEPSFEAAAETIAVLPAPPVTAEPEVAPSVEPVDAAELPPPTAAQAAEPLAIENSPEAVNQPSELAANIAASESVTALSAVALGDRLADEIDETTLALSDFSTSLEPPVQSLATLETVNLTPVIEATEVLAISANNEPRSNREVVAEELPSDEVEASVDARNTETTRPINAIAQDPAVSIDSAEFVDIPVIPPPVEVPAKPATSRQSRDTLARDLAYALETGDHLPALPARVQSVPIPAPSSDRLAVPSREIPLGSGGSLPEVFAAGAEGNLPTDGPPPPPTLATSLGLNFKVLVVAPDDATQAEVRSHVPDAFRTRLNGQSFMQAGAYPTLEEAQARLNQLRQAGLQVQIQEVR